jgi:glycosyltransferase involved in cell wall biosynthesis
MKKKNKNVSVIISCSNDFRVFDCLDSIDYPVDKIVTITPNLEIEKRLKKRSIKYTEVPKGNMGFTRNQGIKLSSGEKIILMDSDTIFGEGAIKKLVDGLDKFDVVKPKIKYKSKRKNYSSKLIAQARDYVNSLPNLAYTPGLAFNRNIKEKVGGYFFRDDIFWAEDSELSYRINENNLTLGYIKKAKIYHSPVELSHELKSAFLLGAGKRKCVNVGARDPDENIIPTIKRFFSGESINKKIDVIRKKGFLVCLFMLIWDLFYNLGYHSRRFKWAPQIEEYIWQTFGQK